MPVDPAAAATELTAEELNTFLNLIFSPFVAIGSLTTFIVGLNAFVALVVSAGTQGAALKIDQAMAYGTARAFVVSIPPALFLLGSTLTAYT